MTSVCRSSPGLPDSDDHESVCVCVRLAHFCCNNSEADDMNFGLLFPIFPIWVGVPVFVCVRVCNKGARTHLVCRNEVGFFYVLNLFGMNWVWMVVFVCVCLRVLCGLQA